MRRCVPSWQSGCVAVASLCLGCQPIPTSGDPLSPVRVVNPTTAPPLARPADPTVSSDSPSDPAATGGGFDFEGEDRPADGGAGEEDPLALQARLLGVDPSTLRSAPAPPRAAPMAAPAPVPTIPAWNPDDPLPDTSWGVRVLATLHDVQPPRAVLGLPDGTEEVVRAGAMLPDHRVVVLAVGRDIVQLARVNPDGFSARVESLTLQSLFPSRPPQQ